MLKGKQKLAIIIFTLLLFGSKSTLCAQTGMALDILCGEREKYIETGTSKYCIVSSAFFNKIEIKKHNAVILIEDMTKLIDHEELLVNNKMGIASLCGYDYDVLFIDKENRLFRNVLYNVECDEYCFEEERVKKLMGSYIEQLKHNPTHYQYRLQIAGQVSALQVDEAFADDPKLIYFSKEEDRFTKLRIILREDLNVVMSESEYKKDKKSAYSLFTQKILKHLDYIKTDYSPIEIGKLITGSLNFRDGKGYFSQGELDVYFENGATFNNLEEIEEQYNLKMTVETPEFWYVTVLSESDDFYAVRKQMSKYNIVEDVTSYVREEVETLDLKLTSADASPQFAGGADVMRKYIDEKVAEYKLQNEDFVKGRITLRFKVTKRGKIEQIALSNSLSNNEDREALMMVQNMPDFVAGKQDGENIDMHFTLAIDFK